MFVVDSVAGFLTRVDVGTNAVVDSIPLEGSPADVTVGGGFVWVTDSSNDRVLRVDPSLAPIDAYPVGDYPQSIEFGAGAVWVSNERGQSLSRIDPRTGVVDTIPLDDTPGDIAVGLGRVWLILWTPTTFSA
jgi:DNA-binding beta-propeller fold protein YncE